MQDLILSTLRLKELEDSLRQIVKEEIQNITREKIDGEELWTIGQTANYLKVSLPTIHEHFKKGFYCRHKIGNRTLIKKSEVIRALKRIG